VKVFDVTSSIEANDAQLRPGLTARIDLNVERHQNVVYIPVAAVTRDEDQPVVYVWNGGHAVRRKVVLGVSNSEHVVVKEGVRPGERLVLGPVTGGTRVIIIICLGGLQKTYRAASVAMLRVHGALGNHPAQVLGCQNALTW